MKRTPLFPLCLVASFGLAIPVAAQGMMHGSDGMMGGMMNGGMMSGQNSFAMRMFDADKDGTLTPEEMTAGMQAEIKTYDTDTSGSLSLAEFAAMHAAHTRTMMVRAFQMHDEDVHESGMRNHPLTPMTDPNLVRVLQAQCKRKVGLIDYKIVAQGEAAICRRMGELREQGVGLAIVDALSNDDLLRLGPALKELPLLTAGSGVAIGLAQNFGLVPSPRVAALPPSSGLRAVLSGSCSQATARQVRAFIQGGRPALVLDPMRIAAGVDVAAEALAWAGPLLASGPVLVYSGADPGAVKSAQERLGAAEAGALLEHAIATIARGLVQRGVRQLVVAGGETSGACVQALNIGQMKIGAQIDPGVPWCHAQADAAGGEGLHLALKSGNFGADDFFARAFALLA